MGYNVILLWHAPLPSCSVGLVVAYELKVMAETEIITFLCLQISQICIGITGIAFASLVSAIDESVFLIKIPYWGGILYIISGSLAVAAARNPKIPLVKGMLAMNAISAITAGVGIVVLSFTVSPIHSFSFAWNCNYNGYDTKEKCDEIENIGKGILVVLTVFTILEFCIAISVASFGCKMLCRDPFAETVVVIYQNVTPANAEQHPPFDCKQPVIHP
ncbi:membrane-spanning 4-domains subfamily A member 4A-like isoform X1 [Crotalus tigris]|uniref:membrane-spanning 4-domains subfamily A member 4A-like isoform X1 n=1 Tax=Crotalus tigris TaxID=88082 RepID=UPI00192F2384|nr:membrane-spanning 4-domains subfamily A member 4A-like isoform X1 [Crotalus tigris]